MSDGADRGRADRGRADRDAGLARVALRHRVRTITGGRVDLSPDQIDGSVVGVVVDGRAFYQTDDPRGLGPALRWAATHGARHLTLIAESSVAADLARRAGLVGAGMETEVWSAAGPDVEPAESRPVPSPPDLPADHLRFAAVISEAGARPVDDHGLLVAEVAGLEVARVLEDDSSTGPRLSVGVGQADRELQHYLHGHLDDDTNLRRAIAAVARHRRPGSAAHPLTRLARQRWLRSVLLDHPGRLGLSSLEPLTPLRPRDTLLGHEPAAAAGPSVVVVCSVGVDLDLVPEAADYRERTDPGADLVVVVPERDRRLAGAGATTAVPRLRITSIEVPWEAPAARRPK